MSTAAGGRAAAAGRHGHHAHRPSQQLETSPRPDEASSTTSKPNPHSDDVSTWRLPPQEERLLEGNLPKKMRESPMLCFPHCYSRVDLADSHCVCSA